MFEVVFVLDTGSYIEGEELIAPKAHFQCGLGSDVGAERSVRV